MNRASWEGVPEVLAGLARWLRAVEGQPVVIVRRDGPLMEWFRLKGESADVIAERNRCVAIVRDKLDKLVTADMLVALAEIIDPERYTRQRLKR